MQSAHLFYNLITRSYVKVIGVGQLHLCADLLQILRGQAALDGTGGGNILEGIKTGVCITPCTV